MWILRIMMKKGLWLEITKKAKSIFNNTLHVSHIYRKDDVCTDNANSKINKEILNIANLVNKCFLWFSSPFSNLIVK